MVCTPGFSRSSYASLRGSVLATPASAAMAAQRAAPASRNLRLRYSMIDSMAGSVIPRMGSAMATAIPYVGVGYRHTPWMHTEDGDDEAGDRLSARAILSRNVRRLIDDAKETRPHLGSILKVAEVSKKLTHGSGSLSKSRVGRIVTGSHPTDIDALSDLAQVFGLQPWQLLVENLNPKALPQLVSAGLLSQIRQIVESVPAPTQHPSSSATDEQPLQQMERAQPAQVGPGLSAAFNVDGMKNNASSTPAGTQKQKSRRRG